jgi:hypothetical protein
MPFVVSLGCVVVALFRLRKEKEDCITLMWNCQLKVGVFVWKFCYFYLTLSRYGLIVSRVIKASG